MTLRILSWNILQGGGRRCEDIVHVIKDHAPDILTLQEFRHGASKARLLDGLSTLGLSEIYTPPIASTRENSLIVASRYPFDASNFPSGSRPPVRCVKSKFTLPSATLDLNLIAVYFPQKKLQIPLFEALLALPDDILSGQSLLLGDFNCGIPFEDSETKTFYATHLFQQLLRQGWIDAWRSRHKDLREYTWISTRKHNGFRYDHAFVSPSLNSVIELVRYDHSVRERGYSDHSAMLLRLRMD